MSYVIIKSTSLASAVYARRLLQHFKERLCAD